MFIVYGVLAASTVDIVSGWLVAYNIDGQEMSSLLCICLVL